MSFNEHRPILGAISKKPPTLTEGVDFIAGFKPLRDLGGEPLGLDATSSENHFTKIRERTLTK